MGTSRYERPAEVSHLKQYPDLGVRRAVAEALYGVDSRAVAEVSANPKAIAKVRLADVQLVLACLSDSDAKAAVANDGRKATPGLFKAIRKNPLVAELKPILVTVEAWPDLLAQELQWTPEAWTSVRSKAEVLEAWLWGVSSADEIDELERQAGRAAFWDIKSSKLGNLLGIVLKLGDPGEWIAGHRITPDQLERIYTCCNSYEDLVAVLDAVDTTGIRGTDLAGVEPLWGRYLFLALLFDRIAPERIGDVRDAVLGDQDELPQCWSLFRSPEVRGVLLENAHLYLAFNDESEWLRFVEQYQPENPNLYLGESLAARRLETEDNAAAVAQLVEWPPERSLVVLEAVARRNPSRAAAVLLELPELAGWSVAADEVVMLFMGYSRTFPATARQLPVLRAVLADELSTHLGEAPDRWKAFLNLCRATPGMTIRQALQVVEVQLGER